MGMGYNAKSMPPVQKLSSAIVIGKSRLVGTPRCGVRTAQRAVPTIPGPPSLTDCVPLIIMLASGAAFVKLQTICNT
jgi:hypothetical protein